DGEIPVACISTSGITGARDAEPVIGPRRGTAGDFQIVRSNPAKTNRTGDCPDYHGAFQCLDYYRCPGSAEIGPVDRMGGSLLPYLSAIRIFQSERRTDGEVVFTGIGDGGSTGTRDPDPALIPGRRVVGNFQRVFS